MSETGITTSPEFIKDINKDSLSAGDPGPDKDPTNKQSNVKENNGSRCQCPAGCDGSQRILNEDNLKELLGVLRDQQNSCNGDTLCKTDREKWAQCYSYPRLFLSSNANENDNDPFVLQPSLFHKNHVPPFIYFTTKLSEDSRPPIGLPKCLQSLFRWKISSITPNSIRNCISFMKFDMIRQSNMTDTMYLGSWCKHMLTAEFSQLEDWRKVNHYPGSFHLGRKDKLWCRLRLAHQKFGEKFDVFHPRTFVLPRDYDELCEYWSKAIVKLFIIKPPASARGNGIKVINDISQIPSSAMSNQSQATDQLSKKSTMIVQQYISNPCLLENGRKFDLRIYVLLTSVDPLRIYVYEEGLVRFASSKYSSQEDGIIDQYMHLTNYFINKNNQDYQINNDCNSLHGCKWTLKRFWRYLREHYAHIDAQQLWDKIVDIIIKTIICCEAPMTRLSNQNCKNDYTSYELFGFDIILDDNFKPWILEVNITPSLKSESDLDTSVKYGVIRDMFNLVGYHLPPVSPDERSRLNCLLESGIFFNSKLYTENLTRRDKLKQLRHQKLFKIAQGNLPFDKDICDDINRCEFINRLNQVPKMEELEINNRANIDPMHPSIGNGGANDLDFPKAGTDCILNDLTQNDIRILMLAEDELSRCGQFKRVFPSPTSNKYLKFFDKPRYYNFLLDAWEKKYKDNRMDGICRLSKLVTFMN